MRHFAAALAFATLATTTPALTVPNSAVIQVTRDVQYGSADGAALRLDVYSNGAGRNRPAVVLLHGGEWIRGDKRDLEPEGRRIAAMGWVALSVNYRLTAPSRWPGEYGDVLQALRWVSSAAGTLGIDPNRIALLGSSSGGHLAALVATKGSGQVSPTARVQAVALWSAPLDLTAQPGSDRTTHLPIAIVERFIGCAQATCLAAYRDASPLFHVGASSVPMYIANSQHEIIPLKAARQMAAKLGRLGIDRKLQVLPGSTHGLTADCSVTPCRRGYEALVWDATIAFLRKHIVDAPRASLATAASAGLRSTSQSSPAPKSGTASTASGPAAEPGSGGMPIGLLSAAIVAIAAAVAAAGAWSVRSRRRALSS